jgi:deoxyribodipyrimidine photo-lyase
MIAPQFTHSHVEVLQQVEQIDPVAYARTRNFTQGAVTYLSPYISRGFISTHQVMQSLLARGFALQQMEKLLQELAWREYWQRAWQHLGKGLFTDIKQTQQGVAHRLLPAALLQGNTGITAVDKAIGILLQTGYMHNHLRMYTAAIACNIGQAHWLAPAQWLYYHLLDGDPASNHLSWQWIVGSFSSKKYYCNQENINHYTATEQRGTYLDTDYNQLPTMAIPEPLEATTDARWHTDLPPTELPLLDANKPLLLYNSFNLDPLWHAQEAANRVLVLEPAHFEQFPIGPKVMDFILGLANNIPELQVYAGPVSQLEQAYQGNDIRYKEHPTAAHYPGKAESRSWMFPEVSGYYPSFSAFWKKCQRYG